MFISMCGVNCSRRRWSGFTNIVTAMRWTWLKIADIFLERENSHRFTIYISRYTTSFSVKTHKFMNLCDFTEFLYYSTIPQLVESKDWRMRLNIQKRTMTMLEILDLLHLFFHLSHSTLNKKKNLVQAEIVIWFHEFLFARLTNLLYFFWQRHSGKSGPNNFFVSRDSNVDRAIIEAGC